MVVLQEVEFKKDHLCFKAGECYKFEPGVNLLAGEQGSGKSSLLRLLSGVNQDVMEFRATPIKTLSFDFEKDNPRAVSMATNNVAFEIGSRFISHGETVNIILNMLRQKRDILFFMDEPDASLSMRSCYNLVASMKFAVNNGCQIVAAVHSPVVIAAFENVISLEHKRVMPSAEFIQSHIVDIDTAIKGIEMATDTKEPVKAKEPVKRHSLARA